MSAQLSELFSARMGLTDHHLTEKPLMARSSAPRRAAAAEPESLLDRFRYFRTAQVWKQVLQSWQPCQAWRWQPQPLILVTLAMTWCAGDATPERSETARAF